MFLHISKHINPKGPWKLSTCCGHLAQETISHCFTHCSYLFVLIVKYEKKIVSVTTPGIEFVKLWDSLLSRSCIHEQLLECLGLPNELTEGEAG